MQQQIARSLSKTKEHQSEIILPSTNYQVIEMTYRFISTERGTPSGNRAETCALLHMMCFAPERDEIDLFAIDCFNDVTGMDNSCNTLHDVQSKGETKITPAKLGEYLATLFENRASEFSKYFDTLTLFVGGVSPTTLENPTLTEFRFQQLKPKSQASVREHLIEACKKRRNDIPDDLIDDDAIDDFLSCVRFVVAKKDETEYIRALAHNSSALLTDKRTLLGIFGAIRDQQSSLKNRTGIAGRVIDRPDAVMDFGRTMSTRQIRLLVIQRLLNMSFLTEESPDSFRPYLNSLPPEMRIEDVEEDCRNELCLQYFDKNNLAAFWHLLDEIVNIIQDDPEADIQQIYSKIDEGTLASCTQLTRRSHLYFIATIKDGLRP